MRTFNILPQAPTPVPITFHTGSFSNGLLLGDEYYEEK